MKNGIGSPLSSPITPHGNSSQHRALIIAELFLEHLTNKDSDEIKQFFKRWVQQVRDMDWTNRLLAPRIDHRGMSTPSEASRLFLIITLILTGWWAWNATDGNIVVWFSLTLLVATPILTVGWYLLSLAARHRSGELLTPKVQNALEAKGRWPHHSRKP